MATAHGVPWQRNYNACKLYCWFVVFKWNKTGETETVGKANENKNAFSIPPLIGTILVLIIIVSYKQITIYV